MNDTNILYVDKLTPIRIMIIQKYHRRRYMRKLRIKRIFEL